MGQQVKGTEPDFLHLNHSPHGGRMPTSASWPHFQVRGFGGQQPLVCAHVHTVNVSQKQKSASVILTLQFRTALRCRMLDHSQSVKHSSLLKVSEVEAILGGNVVRLGGTGLPLTQTLGSLRPDHKYKASLGYPMALEPGQSDHWMIFILKK